MLPKPEATTALRRLFKKHRVAELSDICSVLRTTSSMSAFRRLRELEYLSSYSHRGRYYTLPTIAHFDAQGLWRYEQIGFSRLGNLKATLTALIEQSIAGKTHDELERQLGIRVHNSLLELVRGAKITREVFAGVFVYLSMDTQRAQQQRACRQEHRADSVQDLLPEAMVIEVLTEIIRANALTLDEPAIVSRLAARGIDISAAQLSELCTRLGLKKTLGFRS
jgi:hypothetical protein